MNYFCKMDRFYEMDFQRSGRCCRTSKGFILILVCGLNLLSMAGRTQEIAPNLSPDTSATMIILDEPADRVKLFTKNGIQYQELTGNVRMRHDSTFMRTDSAVLDDRNRMEAYGNVVIQELDSTYVFSDTLWYDGNTRLAELIGDVVLEKGKQQLFSNHLLYQMDTRIARYDEKSFMIDSEMQLSSLRGTFYVNEDRVVFRDSVLVISDTFNLKADSMAFYTEAYKVVFLGPTVLYNDTSRIYTESGYYLLDQEEALFYDNAQFQSGTSQGYADSIYYFGNESRYILIGNAFIQKNDQRATANKIIYNEMEGLLNLYGDAKVTGEDVNATGDSLIYNTQTNAIRSRGRSVVQRPDFTLESQLLNYDDEQQQGFASGDVIWADSSGAKRIYSDTLQFSNNSQNARAMGITRRPLFEWSSDKGDTLRLISDTLHTYQNTVIRVDSTGMEQTDTVQDFSAFYNVAIIRDDILGRADSLSYMESDSLIVLFGNPVLWMDTTQLSGDTIFISMNEGTIDEVLIRGNAFIITSPDSIFFNQIKGRQITAYFEEGRLSQTDVEGNAESIYFPLDEEGGYLGMNKIICSRIEMFFEENNVTGIAFLEMPTGDLITMQEINNENALLKGYVDLGHRKPKRVEIERLFVNLNGDKKAPSFNQ